MTPWHAVILGVVEGITEYLPISSTGHLILASSALGLDHPPAIKRATDTFLIVVQGGAILAVVGLYWPRIVEMCQGLFGRCARGRRLLTNLIVAFLPAVVFGLLLEETIDRLLFHPLPVMIALLLGGVVMIAADPWQRRRFHPTTGRTHLDLAEMGWTVALIIGLVQCLAMWPGMSRSMVTIVAGIAMGLRARQAAEFAFLLGLPTLGGATVWKLFKDLTEDGPSMFETLGWGPVLIGVLTAAIAAAVAIKWLVAWLTHHGLAIFGWYRIALTAVVLVLVLTGSVSIDDAPA